MSSWERCGDCVSAHAVRPVHRAGRALPMSLRAHPLRATKCMTMRYAVQAETIGGEATARLKGIPLRFDGSSAQSPTLAGPADLLAAAFAACVLKNVERFSRMLPFRYERASIEVIAEREEPPPRIARIRYVLEVVTDEPAERQTSCGHLLSVAGRA